MNSGRRRASAASSRGSTTRRSTGSDCWVTLGKLPAINPNKPQNEKLLRMAIEMYRDHPALGAWKGFDEPAWVKQPPGPMVAAYKLFKELDPKHPVVIIQARRKHRCRWKGIAMRATSLGWTFTP